MSNELETNPITDYCDIIDLLQEPTDHMKSILELNFSTILPNIDNFVDIFNTKEYVFILTKQKLILINCPNDFKVSVYIKNFSLLNILSFVLDTKYNKDNNLTISCIIKSIDLNERFSVNIHRIKSQEKLLKVNSFKQSYMSTMDTAQQLNLKRVSEESLEEKELEQDRNINSLKKYKELFDLGILTEEEYLEKKDSLIDYI